MGSLRIRSWLWVLPALVIPMTVAGVSWTGHVASAGSRVAPNVRLEEIDVSGLSMAEAAEVVQRRADQLAATEVVLDLGGSRLVTTMGELGLRYQADAVLADLASARHGDDPLSEFAVWAATPFEPVVVPDRFDVDAEKARERLSQEDLVIEAPTEPRLGLGGDGQITAFPGEDGVTIDVERVIATLVDLDPTRGTLSIDTHRVGLPPLVDDAAVAAVAEELNRRTRFGLVAVLDSTTASIPAEMVRPLISGEVRNGELVVEVDQAGLARVFEHAFPEPVAELVPPRFEVVDGQPVKVEDGVVPMVCCTSESMTRAAADLVDGGRAIYALEARPEDDPAVISWAAGTGIREVVAEFTTRHACCENRVVNIHTIADAVRGYYLVPGETLSLNEHVGPRTREKGYLPAGAIRSGHMTDEVGGGVSQFSTTLFNAAFFAGLDLITYQSHSVYFSRYPFGREATLSMPAPDLVIGNSTDHPVLIWPTYGDTSITVTLYSTRNVEVVELEQRVIPVNQCRLSEIDRQRTFSDGRVVVDTIVAFYRPADGIDCNGDPIPEP